MARAADSKAQAGRELPSNVVTISGTDAICPPPTPGSVGAEPFSATISYKGTVAQEDNGICVLRLKIRSTEELPTHEHI